MARGHGRILTSAWEDDDFLDLDEREQRLYLFLISQPNLNHAGLLDLTLRRWARKARGLTVAELGKRIARLEETGFVVVDEDTEELLIRSFIRNDGVWRMPKVMGAAVSGALEISSRRLQAALLAEMARIPLDELNDEPTKLKGQEGPSIRQQVANHINTLRKAFGNPPTDPTGRGSVTPSAPPSGTPSDTPSQPPVEGGAKGSTRGRAGASRAHSPAPTPTPAPIPSPIQEGSRVEADAQAELIVVEDSDFVGAAEAAPLSEPEQVTAQTIVGEWIDRCAKRPPGQTIGQTSKQIKKLLDEGIDPDDIRRGLAKWMAKGSAPSSIPSFVNEAMNAAATAGSSNVFALSSGQPLSGTDAKVAGWAAIAASFDDEDSA
ncbi:hypothetical protein MUK60_07655 [Streptomyces sp. LRE541]|uniref:hypothetical protein n=1 Tax=Streptomyces sp. LRE541 TaxID=2931983 RepID=UPI00200C3A70|nr:hypothetical protein [Streptomyces sp. LRE541]UPZ27709.1 hypothetical protein MUK60_07655 [Streptomyces sp. LRE541]